MNENDTLFLSDLDDTLLNRNSSLSQYTKNTLNNLISNGLYFTIATGRTTDAAQQLMSGVELNMPISSFNGAIIYNIKLKRYVKVCRLAAESVSEIIKILKSYSVQALMYRLENETLVSCHESSDDRYINDFIQDRKSRYNSIFSQVENLIEVNPEQVMYFTLIGPYDRLKPVSDALKNIQGINTAMVDDRVFWWLEIFSSEASKYNTVKFLRETYNFKKVVSFGDNYNDLPMFKASDLCVAVDNALDDVKKACHFVCESNDRDGVVKWIMNYLKQ